MYIVPKCGALTGDSNAPEDFSQAYQPGIEHWRGRMHEEGLKRDTCSTLSFLGGELRSGVFGVC